MSVYGGLAVPVAGIHPDDPLYVLTMIVGDGPENVVPPEFALEEALLAEFEQYDLPRLQDTGDEKDLGVFERNLAWTLESIERAVMGYLDNHGNTGFVPVFIASFKVEDLIETELYKDTVAGFRAGFGVKIELVAEENSFTAKLLIEDAVD